MEKQQVIAALEAAKSESKERKFTQSIDLSISLKDVDLKDPTKRFRLEVLIPHGIDKTIGICVIGDDDVVSRAKEAGVPYTLTAAEVENIARDAGEVKALINNVDYFLSIPQLMGSVGKNLGRFLGPQGKMPSVLPPGADINQFVTRYNRTVRVRVRQNPIVHCRIGTETMNTEEVADNILAVLGEIENKLENGVLNIRNVFVKTTMGPSVKIGA